MNEFEKVLTKEEFIEGVTKYFNSLLNKTKNKKIYCDNLKFQFKKWDEIDPIKHHLIKNANNITDEFIKKTYDDIIKKNNIHWIHFDNGFYTEEVLLKIKKLVIKLCLYYN